MAAVAVSGAGSVGVSAMRGGRGMIRILPMRTKREFRLIDGEGGV